MFGIGTTELLIVLVIVMVLFGAGKLTQVGKQLGTAISEFKSAVKPKEDPEKPADTTENKNA